MSTPALGPVELLDPDRHDTARFSSDVEVLDHWLRRVAPVAAAAGTAATWVLCRIEQALLGVGLGAGVRRAICRAVLYELVVECRHLCADVLVDLGV